MYVIIRLIIGCVFLVLSIIGINKSQIIRKYRLYLVFASMSVALVVALMFLPFENLFVTFSSPKAAYEYFNSGESNIELIVEGDSCDFVVDRGNNSDTYLIIPKTADGWKIGIGSSTNRVIQKIDSGIVIYVYQYKDTRDFFLTIHDTNGGELTVSDELNTKFYSLETRNDFLSKTFTTYYSHISNTNPQYSVMVNGSSIALE